MSQGSRFRTTAPLLDLSPPPEADLPWGLLWVEPALGFTPLSSRRVLLGRTDEANPILAASEVSREHAEVVRDGPLWELRDLRSRNGTYRNRERVDRSVLEEGDVVRLGSCVAVVVRANSANEPPEVSEIAPGLLAGPRLGSALAPLSRASASDLPVVLEGETGVGKEVVARSIHAWSGRGGEFVAINCAALPESIAEAELFGHKKGSFSGATRDAPGYFRSADGGTLLLDEVTDLPLPVQAKLLRALEERAVTPLGSSKPVPVDVRVIVAAQESLHGAVKKKRFRADLFGRVAGVELSLPPLRDRREEVPSLFHRVIREHSGGATPKVHAAAIEALCVYDWPFNVRELAQIAKRTAVLHGHEAELTLAHLPERITAPTTADRDNLTSDTPPEQAAQSFGSEARRAKNAELLERLVAALREVDGNVTAAARRVGISRQKAYRLMGAQGDAEPQQD